MRCLKLTGFQVIQSRITDGPSAALLSGDGNGGAAAAAGGDALVVIACLCAFLLSFLPDKIALEQMALAWKKAISVRVHGLSRRSVNGSDSDTSQPTVMVSFGTTAAEDVKVGACACACAAAAATFPRCRRNRLDEEKEEDRNYC